MPLLPWLPPLGCQLITSYAAAATDAAAAQTSLSSRVSYLAWLGARLADPCIKGEEQGHWAVIGAVLEGRSQCQHRLGWRQLTSTEVSRCCLAGGVASPPQHRPRDCQAGLGGAVKCR